MPQLGAERCNQATRAKALAFGKGSLIMVVCIFGALPLGRMALGREAKEPALQEETKERKETGFSLPASTLITCPHKLH